MLLNSFFLIIIAFACNVAESAKILAIFPLPGPSQFLLVQPLLRSLASRGHELTVISHFPQKKKFPNYRDIQLDYPHYDNVINVLIEYGQSQEAKSLLNQLFTNASIYALENKQVQDLLYSKNEHFNLVFVETFFNEVLYAIGPHFNAPLIGISTFGTDTTIDALVGNTSPASYIPLVTSSLTDRMDFWQRLQNLELIIAEWKYVQFHHIPNQERLYKKYFPHLQHSLRDIAKNFSIVFVNQHFSLSFPRPYVPAMIEIGGIHISQTPPELPRDISDFIARAPHGVIYFALGSNVKSKDLSTEKINAILSVFSRLKERVIWKFEHPTLPGKPDNVLIRQWLPQSNILAHPNVKLFITHAGLLSTIEAIHHAKPVVGIPVFYDQFLNIERAKAAGFGVGIDFHTFTEHDLMNAIQEVLGNSKYRETAKEISRRYHDQPINPLDKAIYWVEYVIRYNGAPHLRISGQDLSFIAFHSIDTWGYLILMRGILPLLLILLAFKVLRILLKSFGKKTKTRKQE